MRMTEEEFARLRERCNIRVAASSPHKIDEPAPNRLFQKYDDQPLTEDKEQEALVNWLRIKGIRYSSTPNGGYRHRKTAAAMKKTGAAAGFPDITIWPPVGSALPILYIEMKRSKGGRLSDLQKEWQTYLSQLGREYGIKVTVCRGCREALEFIRANGYDTFDQSPVPKTVQH